MSNTRRSVGRDQGEVLRVLCASKASTRRTQRTSVTSVLSLFLATENTEQKEFSERDDIARANGRGKREVTARGWQHA
jgi:hypothetical protein